MSDQIIARVSQSLAKEQSLESLVRQLLEMLEMVTDMESTYLTKVDVEARLQHIMFARNSQKMHIPENFTVSWDYSLCKRAIDENCFFSDEVPDRWGDCIAARNLGITTFLSTPIHLPDGSFYGTLCAASSEKRQWSERAEQVLQLFAGLIAQYIQKEALVEQLREANAALIAQSYTDSLTGLPNRRAIFENLTTLFSLARHLNHKIMIAFIDLDNFKLINDTLGHDTGDQLLKMVGERLVSSVRRENTVARLGGDEFVLIAQELDSVELQAAHLAEIIGVKLLEVLNKPYPLSKASRHCTPSIGITLFSNNVGSIEKLMKQADLAMYKAKAAGRNVIRFFDPEMEAYVNQRAAMEKELRDGIEAQQFVLYYQPQIDGDGQISPSGRGRICPDRPGAG